MDRVFRKENHDRNHFWSTNVVHATATLILCPELTHLTSLRKLAKKYSIDFGTLEEATNGLVNIGLLDEKVRVVGKFFSPVRMFRRSTNLDLDVIPRNTP